MDYVDENSVMEPLDNSVTLSGARLLEVREVNVFGQLNRHGRKLFFKAVNQSYTDYPKALSLLRKEYDLGMRMDHRGIVQFLSLEVIPGIGEAILMEWIEGITLAEWMSRKPSGKQRVKAAREIVSAVSYMAHKGVAHRDLKPDNIMVRDRDETMCIIDFGHGDSDDFATHKLAGGTLRFGAPEQKEHAVSDSAADVYSLGKILEFLRLPAVYHPVIKACLSENPASRPKVDLINQRFRRADFLHKAILPAVAIITVMIAGGMYVRQSEDKDMVSAHDSIAETLKDTIGIKPEDGAEGQQPTLATPSPEFQSPESSQPRAASSEPQPAPNAAVSASAKEDWQNKAERLYNESLKQTDALLRSYGDKFRRIREMDYANPTEEEMQEFLKFSEETFTQEGAAFNKIMLQMSHEMNDLGMPTSEVTEYLNKLVNHHRDKLSEATGF